MPDLMAGDIKWVQSGCWIGLFFVVEQRLVCSETLSSVTGLDPRDVSGTLMLVISRHCQCFQGERADSTA